MFATLLAITVDKINPDNQKAAPFVNLIKNLIDALGFYALMAALAGLVIGAGLWAVGSNSQNFSQTYNGKKAVLISAAAALVLGVSSQLVGFAFNQGNNANIDATNANVR